MAINHPFENEPRDIQQIVFFLDGVIAPPDHVRLEAITPNEGVMALIAELTESYTVGAVFDGDAPQFAATEDQEIFNSMTPLNLDAQTIMDDVQLFQLLSEQGITEPKKCLFIDANPKRAMQAIRSGFDVSIFTDTWRLRRDLWLWRILEEFELGRPAV